MARYYVPIIDHYNLESPVATELRRLLHNLRKCETKAELKSILITSAAIAEGKSTVCSLLSITAARKGLKTLLMDCDFRRPTLHKLFGLEREHGMVEVLSEGLAGKSVIKKTPLENLDVITAGKLTPHPTELFDSRAIGSLINELKFYYDYALVDTPPVIPVSDPMLLAQELDGALLVVKAGSTPRELVKRATDIMTSNQTNLLGIVLNNVKGSLPYHYDYTHYHYDYTPKPEAGKSSSSRKDRSGGTKSSRNGRRDPTERGSSSSGDKRVPR